MNTPSRPWRQRERWLRARPYVIPIIVLLCVCLPHLGQGDWRTDQGWYAAIGLQAWREGSLWSLHAEPGRFYFNKPPLAFWIHGLALHVLGPSLLVSRLPGVLAAGVCVVATVALARRFGSRRIALAAGVVAVLTYEFSRRTREITLDMWQLMFMLLALLAAAYGCRTGRGRWVAVAGVPLGLALLCKPLVALLVVPVLGVWFAWNRQGKLIAWLAAALGVALAVAGPWHVSMLIQHGQSFAEQYFGYEILQRARGAISGMNRGALSPLYYVREIGATYWPWMIPLVLALVTWARRLDITRDMRGARAALVWSVLWIVALSAFADKRPRYAIVLYPAWAWLAGMWLGYWPWRWLRRSYRRYGLPVLGVLVVLACALAIAPVRVHSPPNPQWPALYAWLDAHGDPGLWQGALQRARAARLYLERGRWPHPTRDRWDRFIAEPPAGALLIYHRRDGLEPGPNEELVWRSGDLRLMRLGDGGWMPTEIADPGE